MPAETCMFCSLPDASIIARNNHAIAFHDGYPVSSGHVLIIPRRHIGDWWQASPEERVAIFALVDECKAALDEEHQPDGYNIGINCGSAAGQTIDHLHVHLIPRFADDVDDPTGGVRFVIPQKGNYRRPGHIPSLQPQHGQPRLATGGKSDPFALHVRPQFSTATEIEILAAFVQDSGVRLLDPWLVSALERGCDVRILTGDYLNITQADALRRLSDLEHAENLEEAHSPEGRGQLQVRVVEIERIRSMASTFHPKSWIFHSAGGGTAFVGSSNVSRAALETGVEWNLRVDSESEPAAFGEITNAFNSLWSIGSTISKQWLSDYYERARRDALPLPQGESAVEPQEIPTPRDLQQEALIELAAAREEMRDRAMVVMATGLGKTWLAAFDIAQFRPNTGSKRVLFLAHRIEILRQAARTLRALFREQSFSWYVGGEADASGDFVLGSIAKVGRRADLAAMSPTAFDYIVIDEVHHATAESYRRIMSHFRPGFWLGLTATPERADAGNVLALFDECVAYQAGIGAGVALGELVPFHYFGLPDTVDYKPIPWRNSRFEPGALEKAVSTESRMIALTDAMGLHPGKRTLIFCCSIRHATYASEYLSKGGFPTLAVHSGPGSADREASLRALSAGDVRAIATVDLFNEGVDIPLVDRVVMLRPTESPVIFLQQLGRGLRVAKGKSALTVIDFIGNHKAFLNRVRTLLSVMPGDGHALAALLRTPQLKAEGCSIDIDLVAIDLLRDLLPSSDRHVFVRQYRQLKASRDARPTIGEMFRLGYNPGSLKAFSGWFDFVRHEGDLSAAESAVLPAAEAWFKEVERTAMTKSYKMVCLEVLLDHDALFTGMSVDQLAARSYTYIRRAPGLIRDIQGLKEFPDPSQIPRKTWLQYWKKNPIHFWAPWFEVVDGSFRFAPAKMPGGDHKIVASLTRELVDYRMARYRRRLNEKANSETSFNCRVIQTGGTPIIKLPKAREALPYGEANCRLPDGSIWRFRFVKHFINVARPLGAHKNQLPQLMRSWFGADAGQAGTSFQVQFSKVAGTWHIEPAEFARDSGLRVLGRQEAERVAFKDLLPLVASVAAGFGPHELITDEWIEVPTHLASPNRFIVRVEGESMKPGLLPGDLVICDHDRQPNSEHGVVILADFATLDTGETALKRLEKSASEWIFASDNPKFGRRSISRTDAPTAPIMAVAIYNLTKDRYVR